MNSKKQPTRGTLALLPSRAKVIQSAPSLDRLRSAIAGAEHEDANLTGMTRSLDRRLLALNLQQFAPA